VHYSRGRKYFIHTSSSNGKASGISGEANDSAPTVCKNNFEVLCVLQNSFSGWAVPFLPYLLLPPALALLLGVRSRCFPHEAGKHFVHTTSTNGKAGGSTRAARHNAPHVYKKNFEVQCVLQNSSCERAVLFSPSLLLPPDLALVLGVRSRSSLPIEILLLCRVVTIYAILLCRVALNYVTLCFFV